MPEPDPQRILPFETPAHFRQWLKTHHDTEHELWVQIFKKGSGRATISWEEGVIEALCWGWIDGVKKPLNELAYLQRFTPRRTGSNWSKRNREHVERLISKGQMEESGLIQVRAAKSDGRWEKAYAPPSEMTMPDDFIAALEKMPKAKRFFQTLNKTNRYAIAYRLATAKKPETRAKRFNALLEMLQEERKIH